MNAPVRLTPGEIDADAICREEIATQCGVARVYLDLAQGHAELGDDRGLEYDLQAAVAYFKLALAAFRDIQRRRQSANQKAGAL